MTTEDAAQADVLAFDDPLACGVDATALLGGKGVGLVEMTQALALPVPPGFTITTAVCRRYLDGGWPQDLQGRIADAMARLGARLGRSFGDPEAPFLVSVRSGAPVSMPGMMETLLNVGITPTIRERLAIESGNLVFAADTWLRFCRMYAEVVLGIPRAVIAAEASSDGSPGGMISAAERICQLAVTYGGGGIPHSPFAQVLGAVEAVFRSWNSERARVFRAREGIPDSLGTAATVQVMVFGNLNGRSGTGVAFTRDPATGDRIPFGDYLACSQGEDVVAGTHAVTGLSALQQQLPEVHTQLLGILHTLEQHYRDMCDVEFTVSNGTLYILQTRVGRRSPLAAVRLAVGMAEDPGFPLSRAEAVARIDPDILHQLSRLGRVDPAATPIATGLPVSPGVGVGVLCCDPDRAAELSVHGVAVVLARSETSPADVHGMVGAAGLLTTRGGVASHAAVVARSWAIPAITGLTGVEIHAAGLRIGSVLLSEGDLVTVDGTAGALYLGDRRAVGSHALPELLILREWAMELGVDLGGSIISAGSLRQRVDVTLLEVARTVQLKGLCTAERAAMSLCATPSRVDALLADNTALFRTTPRGVALTVAGRAWVSAQLLCERSGVDSAAMEACYGRFLPLNDRFKRVVSTWQLTSARGHTDTEWSDLLALLTSLHTDCRPLVDETARLLARLATYGPRFDGALAALQEGDASMLASPLKDSYHTVWFEYHEELIALSGRARVSEESASG